MWWDRWKYSVTEFIKFLIFPQQKDKHFIEIASMSNEKSKINIDSKNSGILRFDISCKVTIYDNKKKKKKY